ncbi:MAG: hypothetical protein QGD90_06465, partial [Candidatus Hydrogenedentes bacterium]|nr:hypothetical protein [Candidatus Hydrogenedentota bacterium]
RAWPMSPDIKIDIGRALDSRDGQAWRVAGGTEGDRAARRSGNLWGSQPVPRLLSHDGAGRMCLPLVAPKQAVR